jgi:hypothetical protein
MGGFRRPGRGGGVSTPWWLSRLSGGGRGGCNPPPLPLAKSNQSSSWATWIREGGGGGRDPRARAAAQIGHFRPPGRQNPRFASPRTRPERPEKAGGMGGQSSIPPPPLPGPSRPLRGGRRGSSGGGSDSQVQPPPGDPPAAYLSTPGRLPSPRLSLRGLCGDPRGSAATPCGPAPVPSPSGVFPCAKGNFREGGAAQKEGPRPGGAGGLGRRWAVPRGGFSPQGLLAPNGPNGLRARGPLWPPPPTPPAGGRGAPPLFRRGCPGGFPGRRAPCGPGDGRGWSSRPDRAATDRPWPPWLVL